MLDTCTVDLSAVFLDVSQDRLYTLAPNDPARRSAQTVLWRALRGLTLAASPALAYTADEVWQHHRGLLAECESVHLAEWGDVPATTALGSEEWNFLRTVRETVNAAIEPLRAAKTLATTAEADVRLTAPPAWVQRLAPYGPELASFLIVAHVEVVAGVDGSEPVAEVRKSTFAKCDRCWTYRDDVQAAGERPGLCTRCVTALASR